MSPQGRRGGALRLGSIEDQTMECITFEVWSSFSFPAQRSSWAAGFLGWFLIESDQSAGAPAVVRGGNVARVDGPLDDGPDEPWDLAQSLRSK